MNIEDHYLTNYYYMHDKVIKPTVIAYKYTMLEIELHSSYNSISSGDENDLPIFKAKKEIPFRHKYFDKSEIEDVIILDIQDINHLLYGLLRVELSNKIDVLHIETYFLDILLDLSNDKILDFSNKLTNVCDGLSQIRIDSANNVFIYTKT